MVLWRWYLTIRVLYLSGAEFNRGVVGSESTQWRKRARWEYNGVSKSYTRWCIHGRESIR